ncbi:hypothetical protein AGR1C_pAt40047 [Agrobacterium fabacearum TT111]|nr:hypothetical protein AGR1C_pAt40047 [Agrobacterium fabacearum TT111]
MWRGCLIFRLPSESFLCAYRPRCANWLEGPDRFKGKLISYGASLGRFHFRESIAARRKLL